MMMLVMMMMMMHGESDDGADDHPCHDDCHRSVLHAELCLTAQLKSVPDTG